MGDIFKPDVPEPQPVPKHVDQKPDVKAPVNADATEAVQQRVSRQKRRTGRSALRIPTNGSSTSGIKIPD